jgi:hypothetical protein
MSGGDGDGGGVDDVGDGDAGEEGTPISPSVNDRF